MQRVEWISEEELIISGVGLKRKGDRFEISDELAEQLIYQGRVKDVYVERKNKDKTKKKED